LDFLPEEIEACRGMKYIIMFDQKSLFFPYKILKFAHYQSGSGNKTPLKGVDPELDLLESLDLDPAPDSMIKISGSG
jgi:hypothetical protein